MTVMFTLPTTWRPETQDQAPEPAESYVAHDDLGAGLELLVDECAAGPADVLLAAHLKILSLLSEDTGLHTEVELPGLTAAVPVDREAATWRQLVRGIAKDAEAVHPAGDSAPDPGRVVYGPGRHPEESDAYGLRVTAEEKGLRLRARAGVLAPGLLDRLAAMYRLVLEAMAADPDGSALATHLSADERHAVLHEWADGGSAERGEVSVDELIQAQAARTPDASAVLWAEGRLTYRELEERTNRIAHHLVALGARPDTLVGVCLRRTGDLLPALLGVWRSGAGYLPLDPGLPPDRLRLMISAAGCDLVVSESLHRPLLDLPEDRLVLLDEERDAIAARPATAPGITTDLNRLAYVIYTSGSTGVPKGVMIEHRGLNNYLQWTMQAYAARGGGSAVFSSISFDLGIPSLFTPLLTGQPVHLLPEPFELADLGERLAAGAPYSFLKMTPGHLDLLSLDLSPQEAHGLAGVVIAAGDAFTSELAQRWIETAGPGGTGVSTEYGPTEITIGNSGQPVRRSPNSELVPLGTPIPNTTMYVLTDRLDPVPVGVPGEVYVGGTGVARGYLDRPGLTADRFVPDPYGAPGARLYRTGDRARWRPDGSMEFLGRVDHQVKIRGHRVELGEIQARLRAHSAVGEVVVIACGASSRDRSLAAFVIAAPGAEPDSAELRSRLAAELPDYMIPRHFMTIDRIPLTANGKVDSRALQSLLPL